MTIDLNGLPPVAVRVRLQGLKIRTMRWCERVRRGVPDSGSDTPEAMATADTEADDA